MARGYQSCQKLADPSQTSLTAIEAGVSFFARNCSLKTLVPVVPRAEPGKREGRENRLRSRHCDRRAKSSQSVSDRALGSGNRRTLRFVPDGQPLFRQRGKGRPRRERRPESQETCPGTFTQPNSSTERVLRKTREPSDSVTRDGKAFLLLSWCSFRSGMKGRRLKQPVCAAP